jgi:protocatechuate 3,4-dioxygenase beta subunit
MRLRPSRLVALAFLGLVLSSACSDSGGSDPSPVPTTVTVAPATVTLNAIGATQQLTATVKDQNGAAMSGQAITWSSSSTAVASVSTAGVVTALANGTAQVTATAGSASGSAAITVAQAAGSVQTVSGDAQSGTVLTALAQPLVVRVNDSQGNPVEGTSVGFVPSADGGVVTPSTATTDAQGEASTAWTLPSGSGSHTVTASANGASVDFTATAIADAADSVFAASGDGQDGTVDAQLTDPLTVRVVDQYGNPVAGEDVTFTPGAGSGNVLPVSTATNVAGEAATIWTLGSTLGAQTVSVTTAGALKGDPVTFTATGIAPQPASIEIVVGDEQVGLIGDPVNIPPVVRVLDGGGNPFPGATVTFDAAAGGGTVTPATVVSDADGLAEVDSWVLGSGQPNLLTATVAGIAPDTFTVVALNATFDMDVRIVSPVSPTQEQMIRDAEAIWERAVFGDLPNVLAQADSATLAICDIDIPGGIDEEIDDMIVYVKVDSIDGPLSATGGGVLATGGGCFVRTVDPRTTVIGRVIIDSADIAGMEAAGALTAVVVHEIGHVIGIGNLWFSTEQLVDLGFIPPGTNCDECRGFINDMTVVGGPMLDTYYDAPQGLWAFDRVGGDAYTAGNKVPLENDNQPPAPQYGTGSLNVHWRETVFGSELMTPSIGSSTDPLSIVTLAAVNDLGYYATFAGAQGYTLPAPGALSAGVAGRRFDLSGDARIGPVYGMTTDGRIVNLRGR